MSKMNAPIGELKVFRIGFLVVVLIAMTLTIGCGKKMPTLGEVDGILTLNGKPLDEVQIEFLPDPEKENFAQAATALTDTQGQFKLKFRGAKEKFGTSVGSNRVVLHDFKAMNSRDNPMPPRFPNEYTMAASTPISIDVVAGKQTINIEIAKFPAKQSGKK
jgi:hypothetical protein